MKICTEHWGRLRTLIAERGLDAFVAKDDKEAVKRLASQMEGPSTTINFDPLIFAHNLIVENCCHQRLGGILEIFSLEGCPICYCRDNCSCPRVDCRADFERYVEHAANDAFQEAVRLGLVSSDQATSPPAAW